MRGCVWDREREKETETFLPMSNERLENKTCSSCIQLSLLSNNFRKPTMHTASVTFLTYESSRGYFCLRNKSSCAGARSKKEKKEQTGRLPDGKLRFLGQPPSASRWCDKVHESVSDVTIDDGCFYVLLHKLCMINYVIEEQKKLYFIREKNEHMTCTDWI